MQLIPVKENELSEVLHIQKMAFKKLYETYHDHQISSYTQAFKRLAEKYHQSNNYFFFVVTSEKIGFIRIVLNDMQTHARISPIAILPEQENHGFGQQALALAEKHFSEIKRWQLSTILQEEKLVHFYPKAGYIQQKEVHPIQENMTITFFNKEILLENKLC
jgi:ribosomal protein S18 acetylase RimI-like enzyme